MGGGGVDSGDREVAEGHREAVQAGRVGGGEMEWGGKVPAEGCKWGETGLQVYGEGSGK